MFKKFFKKIFPFRLTIVLLSIGILSTTFVLSSINRVEAAAVSGFNYSGLSAEDSGSSWKYISSTSTFSASATGVSGTCSDSTSTSSNLTIKNSTGVAGTTLVLTFTKSGGGTFKINNKSGSAGTNTYTLGINGTVVVNVTSERKGGATTTLNVKIDSFTVPSAEKTTYFDPSPNGKYSIKKGDGSTVWCTDSRISITQSQADDLTITTQPDSGYKLVEWLKNDTHLNTLITFSFKGSDDGAVYKPVFTESDNPVFLVGSSKYYSLDAAINAALNGTNKKIIVYDDGVVKNGTYTIPSGITLLIPHDASYSTYTNLESSSEGVDADSYTSPNGKKYKKLTLEASNGNQKTIINVSGTINVSSRFSVKGQVNGTNGCPSGYYGQLEMGLNSQINLNNGSKLYAWGFITGSGEICAKNGSNVYELMQIKDFRGGNHTKNTYSKVFPFNQFYIQNIEVPLKYFKGSTETLRTGFYVKGARITTIPFIGSSGMFRIPSSVSDSDYLLKMYDGSKDRLIFETHGTFQMSSMNVSIYDYNIQSSKYQLPLTNNISIYLKDNSTLTITGQDITMLPGVELFIENGSTLNIDDGSSIYLMDIDEYDGQNYSGGEGSPSGSNIYPINFSPTKTYNRQKPVDATICVEGKIYVKGDLYTSTNNANIYSTSEFPGSITYTFSSSKQTPDTVSAGKKILQIKGAHGISYSGDEPDTENVLFYLGSLKNADSTFVSIRDYYLNLSSEEQNDIHTFSYNGVTGTWNGKQGGGTVYQLRLVDDNFSSFVVQYPRDGTDSSEKFVFPDTNTILDYIDTYYSDNENASLAFRNGNNQILYWEANGTYYKAGVETDSALGLKTMDIHPIWSGWINDENLKYLFASETISYSFATGLYRTQSPYSNNQAICKFTTSGLFDSQFRGIFNYSSAIYQNMGDDQLYYILDGLVIETEGLIQYNSNYYYISSSNILYKSGTYYVSEVNEYGDNITPGYYYFNADGTMVIPANAQKPSSIHNGKAYISYIDELSEGNVSADDFGLFALGSYLYYAGENGDLITDSTFYVSTNKINNCKNNNAPIEEGLYYFDSNGCMYDNTFTLITKGSY